MRTQIIDGNILMLIADDGKVLTEGEGYYSDIRLANPEDQSKYSEVDESEVPTENELNNENK